MKGTYPRLTMDALDERRSPASRKRSGAVIVEMALVLPIFLTVAMGIISCGRATSATHVLASAARLGARAASQSGSTNSEIDSLVRDLCESSLKVNRGTVTVKITIVPAPGNSDPGDDVSRAKTGDLCTVTVEVPVEQVTIVSFASLAGKRLASRCVMRHN